MKCMLALVRRKAGSNSTAIKIRQRPFLKLILAVVLCLCSYLFFSRLVVSAVEVKGASMSPTLTAGDHFLLNRFAFLHRDPQRGELVVIKDPETGDLIVKRIVGMPCETVVMQSDVAYVNGHRLFEPYASALKSPSAVPLGKPTVIARDHYFVLGDNRTRSVDSRAFGPVSREAILGVITL